MQTKWYLHGQTQIYSANDVNIIVPMKAVVLLDALKNRETKFFVSCLHVKDINLHIQKCQAGWAIINCLESVPPWVKIDMNSDFRLMIGQKRWVAPPGECD